MNTFLRNMIMKAMQAHRGRANAIPRDRVHEHLKLFKQDLDDRGFRNLYSGLPICSCKEGLFLPMTTAEVLEFKEYLTKGPGGPIVAHRRCATIYAYYPSLIPPPPEEQMRLAL